MAVYIVRHPKEIESYGVMIISATNKSDLFWGVDEFIDPFICKYKKLSPKVNTLVYLSPSESGQWKRGGLNSGSVELGEAVSEALLDDKGWHEFNDDPYTLAAGMLEKV